MRTELLPTARLDDPCPHSIHRLPLPDAAHRPLTLPSLLLPSLLPPPLPCCPQGVSLPASRTIFGACFMCVLFMSFGGFMQVPLMMEQKK